MFADQTEGLVSSPSTTRDTLPFLPSFLWGLVTCPSQPLVTSAGGSGGPIEGAAGIYEENERSSPAFLMDSRTRSDRLELFVHRNRFPRPEIKLLTPFRNRRFLRTYGFEISFEIFLSILPSLAISRGFSRHWKFHPVDICRSSINLDERIFK